MDINKEEILSVLKELHSISGLRISLHGTDYREIAAYPEYNLPFCEHMHALPEEYKRCMACDKEACEIALTTKKTYIYKCRHGLLEAVSPLYNFGTLTGFLMMGQVLDGGCGAERARLKESFGALADAIPEVSAKTFPSYVSIMTVCARYLTLSNAIPSARPSLAKLAMSYLHENFREKISIREICESIGCSKTSLIMSFKREYGTTVNSYITELRTKEAARMLETSDKSIKEIAHSVGFADQSYFSKVFSGEYGISPSEYAVSAKNKSSKGEDGK